MAGETIYPRGSKVRFSFGPQKVVGVVKEDRGRIGKGGRRLYSIEYRQQQEELAPSVIELPAEELELVESPIASR